MKGSITKLKNGKYWARVTINSKRISLGCYSTREEAQQTLDANPTKRKQRVCNKPYKTKFSEDKFEYKKTVWNPVSTGPLPKGLE